ncbi:MAG: hypothetical protein H7329_07560 [Opitutaceae bacterium]|nr:hypothetical protein [Cytophagales bacterium]
MSKISFGNWSVQVRFNGKEKDLEGICSVGSTYDYGFRIYNPVIGKFLSVDPLTKDYPELTPYQFAANTPIQAIDLDGLEPAFVMDFVRASESGYNNIIEKVNDTYTKSMQATTDKISSVKTETVKKYYAVKKQTGITIKQNRGFIDQASTNLDNTGNGVLTGSIILAVTSSWTGVGAGVSGTGFLTGFALKTASDQLKNVANVAEGWADDNPNKVAQAFGNFVINQAIGKITPSGTTVPVQGMVEGLTDMIEDGSEKAVDKFVPPKEVE